MVFPRSNKKKKEVKIFVLFSFKNKFFDFSLPFFLQSGHWTVCFTNPNILWSCCPWWWWKWKYSLLFSVIFDVYFYFLISSLRKFYYPWILSFRLPSIQDVKIIAVGSSKFFHTCSLSLSLLLFLVILWEIYEFIQQCMMKGKWRRAGFKNGN